MKVTASFEKKMLLSFILGIFLALFLNILIEVLSVDRLFPSYSTEIKPWLFRLPLALGLLLYGVLTPVIEELIFRRVFFKLLCTYVLTPAAGAASAVIFGLYHGNAVQFIYAFIFGLLLAYCYWRFDSLLSPIMIHGAANGVVYLLYFIKPPAVFETNAFKAVILIISALVSILIIRYFYTTAPKKDIQPEKPVFPR